MLTDFVDFTEDLCRKSYYDFEDHNVVVFLVVLSLTWWFLNVLDERLQIKNNEDDTPPMRNSPDQRTKELYEAVATWRYERITATIIVIWWWLFVTTCYVYHRHCRRESLTWDNLLITSILGSTATCGLKSWIEVRRVAVARKNDHAQCPLLKNNHWYFAERHVTRIFQRRAVVRVKL